MFSSKGRQERKEMRRRRRRGRRGRRRRRRRRRRQSTTLCDSRFRRPTSAPKWEQQLSGKMNTKTHDQCVRRWKNS
jgi:hypothetical protein